MARKKKSDPQVAANDTPDNATAPGAAPADAAADVQRPAFEPDESMRSVSFPAAEPLSDAKTNRSDISPPDPALAGLFAPLSDAPPAPATTPFNLGAMTPVELYALRQDIDSRLPPRTLSDVDLVEELLLQYQIAKAMMASVLSQAGVPANQKAQVLNSCASVLEQVTKTQTALYNAERIKAIEQSLEKAFANAPQHVKEAFYTRYEVLLRESAGRRQEKKQ